MIPRRIKYQLNHDVSHRRNDCNFLLRILHEDFTHATTRVDDLAGMDVPALVLIGEYDKAFLRAGQVMAPKLPRARHVVIPGAGHIVNIEQEALVNEALISFLGDLV